MAKYLIINPFGIGDVLFTTPVVRAIKEDNPENFIGYWCNERVEPILKNNPNISKIFALSRGDLKKIYQASKWQGISSSLGLFFSIRREHFDICLDFSLDHRYSLISKLAGISRRIGFNYKKRGRFLTDKVNIDGYHTKHAVEYYLDLLKFINIKPKSKNLDLFIPKLNEIRIRHIFDGNLIEEKDLVIGIGPGAGASWGKDAAMKHWPALKFAQLADRITDGLKAKIIVLGDESERPIADIITNAMRHKPLDLVGKTTLEDLSAAIKNLRLLITNDGGLMHMAVALGVKTVAIFGPADDKVYGPYPPSANNIVIKKDLACRPCYKNFRLPACEFDKECVKSISVDEVFAAVRRL